MANKLIFPIGFDLEQGLKQAKTDLTKVAKQIEEAIAKHPIQVAYGINKASADKLRQEAKDIDRVLAEIKNNYGNGQLKGLTIGFTDTRKLILEIKELETKLRSLQSQRVLLINANATVEELQRIDKEINHTEGRISRLNYTFNQHQTRNNAIAQQIIDLKRLAEELAGIDRMYARLHATQSMNGQSANTFEANEMLARRKQILEDIARITKTASEAQKEMFAIKGIGLGASQGTAGYGGEYGLRLINEQITRYEQLKNTLQELDAQYERLNAMQQRGSADYTGRINATLKERAAIQKELNEITRTAAQAQAEIDKKAKETAASYQRGKRAMDSFAKAIKLPETRISNIQKKITMLNAALTRVNIGSDAFRKISMELDRLGRKLDDAKSKQEAFTTSQKKSGDEGANAFKKQSSYLSILVQRLAVYASFNQLKSFIANVREVTAQFELQQVSLGAIINNQLKAKQIFSEIKQFALKSPVKILDLTKYTKQLAAFRFETDTLFDTTKRIADISVGLGVSMDRLILAFGHVKAATYLTGITLKQFSMAGIPMLELLSEKYTELEGKTVSTTDVLKRVHDKMVSFDDVNQIFQDLTSSGGMFFDMQEKQGNTLYGMWAKLGDAASIMYDEIGRSSWVNKGMKDAINMLSSLMRNWRNVGLVLGEIAVIMGIYKIRAANAALAANALSSAEVRALAVKKVHLKTQPLIIRSIIGETNARKLSIAMVRAQSAAVRSSATATNIFTRSWNSLKAAFLSNPFGIILTALAALVTYLIFADDKTKRLQSDINSIRNDSVAEAEKSVHNFEQLANKAVMAADGSKEQKDALDELQRTYKDMIPLQDLTIEKLKKMRGNYDSLTQAIKEHIYQRGLEQQTDRIIEHYTGTIVQIERKLREEMKKGVKYQVSDAVHTSDLNFDDKQISAFFSRIKERAKDTSKDTRDIIEEAINDTFGYLSQKNKSILRTLGVNKKSGSTDGTQNSLRSIVELYQNMNLEIDGAVDYMSTFVGYLGKYKETLDEIDNKAKEFRLTTSKGFGVDRDTFLFTQGQNNWKIKQWAHSIKTELQQAGVTVQEGVFNLVERIKEGDPSKISSIDFSKLLPILDKPEIREKLGNDYETFKTYVLTIQRAYEGIVPSDPIVQATRTKLFEIGNATKVGMDKMKKYLWDGKTEIKDHLKTLKESAESLKAEIYKYSNYIKLFGSAGKTALQFMGIDVDALNEEYNALTKQINYVQNFVEDKSSGKKADPRLQTLQEIANKMAEVNKKYDDLLKKEGQAKALADTQDLFAKTFAQMQKTADKYNFKLPEFKVPETVEDVQNWYKSVIGEIERLGIKDAEKILIELDFKSGEAGLDKLQKNIEQQLKKLSDRISRTKTAKEFYEKILSQTGDFNLAKQLSEKLYGTYGAEANDYMFEYISDLVKNTSAKLDLNIFNKDMSFDPQRLREFAEAHKDALGEDGKAYQELIKLADDADKDFAKTIEGWLNATKKAETFGGKLTDIYRTTAAEIEKIQTAINNGRLDPTFGKELIDDYQRKEAEEVAKLQYEAFKDSPMYVQMFDDLDHASTKMLENMKSRLEDMRDNWKNLDPTQLKELQSRLNEIDSQLTKRNPFGELVKGIKKYRKLMKEGDGSGNNGGKGSNSEREAVQYMIDTAKAADEARTKYEEILHKDGATKEEIADAKRELDEAMSNEKAAQKAVENWKKVKDTIGLSANELFQMLNWAGDIAQGIADVSEALGADEEDVQYWNDIASALGDITAGIQDIVTAAMSGDVVGIISSALTALPKMFVGFVNLFSAGKIKKANKEIKRQQQLLEQLEYTYSRLQAAADKLFGGKYINNYKQQIKNLQAQAQAYQKQAEAEKSKGKKKDKEKIKEYEQAYRDTMDEIADMQSQISAQMLGNDLASAARDFAKAWLDAYKEIGSAGAKTTDALKEKFSDMVENMVVEGALAAVMERALKPMFDMIDNMSEQDFYSQDFWKRVVDAAERGAANADAGAQTMMSFLEQAGINLREINDEYTGTKRDIASASEETMNNVAAIGNTLMYYVSPIPTISENVAIMRQLMENGGSGIATTNSAVDTTALWNRHLELQQGIYTHTLRNAEACEQMALKCATIAEELHKVIAPRGKKGTSWVCVGGI